MTNENITEEKKTNVKKIDLHAELVETGVEQVLNDLDTSLIGLEPVKTRIRETAALLLVEKAREKLGGSSTGELTTRLKNIITSVDGNVDRSYINNFVDNEFLSIDSLFSNSRITFPLPLILK